MGYLIKKYFTNHIVSEQQSPNEIKISGLSKTGGYILVIILMIETSIPLFSYLLNLQFVFDYSFFLICCLVLITILFGFRFSIYVNQEVITFYDTFLFFRVPRIKGLSQNVEIYGELIPKSADIGERIFVKGEDDGGWDSAFESEWLLIQKEEKGINLGNQQSTPEIIKYLKAALSAIHPNKYQQVEKPVTDAEYP